MTIDEFCARHAGTTTRSIDDLVDVWGRERERDVDALLHAHVGAGVVLRDVLVGDGIVGQVGPELREAFAGLMGEKADTYDKVRRILWKKLKAGDESVVGLVHKIKGQVGEHRFVAQVGAKAGARLATLGNQEGWDVAIDHAWGTQHIQVKMYSDADRVVRQMKAVGAKLARGRPILDGGTVVERIDFAVPENIAAEVARKAKALGLDADVIPIKATAKDVGDVVWKGVNNVGPGAMKNVVKQLLGVAATAAVVHGIASTFLVYKGAKDRREALGDVAQNTAITVAGATAGAAAEFLLRRAMCAAGPTGILVAGASMTTRAVFDRVLERTDHVRFLQECNTATDRLAHRFLAISSSS